MSEWSLARLLGSLHDDIERRLKAVRQNFAHPGTKGDASEEVWLDLLETYLPRRYQTARAHVVDSRGKFSDQIDVVVFDRQYSPFILRFEGRTIIPAESVYAVFETKQAINASQVRYAMDKVATVRRLHRTSLPIPHAGGTFAAKPPIHMYGGLLALESEWNPALGDPLLRVLSEGDDDGRLDLGCVAAHGYFTLDRKVLEYQAHHGGRPATAFLFELISRLQLSGTVPMIDVQAYARWLSSEPE